MALFDGREREMPLAGNPLDRVDLRREDEGWLAARRRDAQSRVVLFDDLRAVMRVEDGLAPLWFPITDFDAEEAIYLGLADGVAHFALSAPAGWQAPDGSKAIDLRSIALQLGGGGDLALLGQARALLAWQQRRSFCSNCGQPTQNRRGGYIRQCSNTDCGAQHFPRTDPVAIMLPVAGARCLLGRNAKFPQATYSALAGFIEPGETIEEAVRREVAEEAGIEIGQVRYVASQPWPFPSSLMIGCLAEALSFEIEIDPREIADARWVTREEARAALAGNPASEIAVPPAIAIAHHLIKFWVEHCS